MLGLWRNCSNAAHITPDNPLGLAGGLLRDGPLPTFETEWIPALDAATAAFGRPIDVLGWMIFGQKIIDGVMCADSYASLVASGTGHPKQYVRALLALKRHCRTLYVYHGSPRYIAEPKNDYTWLLPTLIAEAVPVYDAEADRKSLAMQKLADHHWRLGLPFAVEPFVKPGTPWEARQVPCFVLLSKVRETIRKGWSKATGAVRDYPFTNVLIPDADDINLDEIRGFWARGWTVFLPLDTPIEIISQLGKIASEAATS